MYCAELGVRRRRPGGAKAFRGDAREVARKWGEATLVVVRDDARQLQQLEGHLGVQHGCLDLDATLAGLIGIAAAEGFEEFVQALLNVQFDDHGRI